MTSKLIMVRQCELGVVVCRAYLGKIIHRYPFLYLLYSATDNIKRRVKINLFSCKGTRIPYFWHKFV